MAQRSAGGRKAKEKLREVADGQLRLLRLAAKGRLHRYYYSSTHFDVVDRGLLAGSIPATTATLEDMVEKGWLEKLPASSQHARLRWTITVAGTETITTLTEGRR